jgi:hypothetical protein
VLYSFKTIKLQEEQRLAGLKLALVSRPGDEKLLRDIRETEDNIRFYEEEIKKGNDRAARWK